MKWVSFVGRTIPNWRALISIFRFTLPFPGTFILPAGGHSAPQITHLVAMPALGIIKNFLGVFKDIKICTCIWIQETAILQQNYKLWAFTHHARSIWWWWKLPIVCCVFLQSLSLADCVKWHLENWKNLYKCGGSRGGMKHNTSLIVCRCSFSEGGNPRRK